MKRKVMLFVYSFVLVVFVFQNTVYAYIDPGAVSAVIQTVAASVLVGGASFGLFFNRIKNASTRKRSLEKKDLPKQFDNED